MPAFDQTPRLAGRTRPPASLLVEPTVAPVATRDAPPVLSRPSIPGPPGDGMLSRSLATAIEQRSRSVDLTGITIASAAGPTLQRGKKKDKGKDKEWTPLSNFVVRLPPATRGAVSSQAKAADTFANELLEAVARAEGAGAFLTEEEMAEVQAEGDRVVAEMAAERASWEAQDATDAGEPGRAADTQWQPARASWRRVLRPAVGPPLGGPRFGDGRS